MLEDILSNVIAGLVCTGLAYGARKVIAYFSALSDSPPRSAKYSKRLVRSQFLITLFTLVFSLPVGFLLTPSTALLALVKLLLLFAAGFSFVFLWGAFDAAFEFYPDDDSWHDKPSNQGPGQARNE